MSRRIEINPGDKFGHLTVLGENPTKRYPNGEVYRNFKCECVCGKVIESKSLGHLRGRKKISCGCQKGTHRKSSTPENQVWRVMKQRCNNPKTPNYHLYGALGIKVCDRWDKFENFIADMGERPSPDHSIDRYPDKDGDYEPSNCRWATRQQQQWNLRSNKMITFRGETKCAAEWAAIAGKAATALRYQKTTDEEIQTILTRWLPDYGLSSKQA